MGAHPETESPAIVCDASGDQVLIAFSGAWLVSERRPDTQDVLDCIVKSPEGRTVYFSTESLSAWDTGLVVPLVGIYSAVKRAGLVIDVRGLPSGADRLAKLALAVEEREGARRDAHRDSFLASVGVKTLDALREISALVAFTGEVILSFRRFLNGSAVYRKQDFLHFNQEAGVDALPIVGLISFLIGMIFAFVGIMQLKLFGAGIYTADLVAIAMVRELAPIMTAIVVAGRTGAAYAAQLGTMKVNEELDALTTLGIHPIDYLVTPRLTALVLMMPFLTMYASLFGIIGGTVVSLVMLDVSLTQYVSQTIQALNLNGLFSGLFKAVVYGALVAIAGCHQGMACGGSALAVGQSTTQAVVSSIVLIVVSAATLTVIYINLGI